MLGPARDVPLPGGAWEDLENGLGVQLPDDYERVLSAYAPVQLNVHLCLKHPSTPRWNLRESMEHTISAFSRSDLSDARCPGFPDGPRFGGAAGLIPLTSTDRGEHLFGAVDADSGEWRLPACNGDEQDFHEYRMSFAGWLHRYLTGEDAFGPGSAVFHPGPVLFEGLPMTASEHTTEWYGPERGM
ncbi:SMI1/KNR4 family protein [Streptomyces sp. NPDC017936]|uniref:SMI1/KNR4 family protein n=1 Tax=Streptomyces sp. NPDC017936 TaxID=3365016 RepID=UPI003791549F